MDVVYKGKTWLANKNKKLSNWLGNWEVKIGVNVTSIVLAQVSDVINSSSGWVHKLTEHFGKQCGGAE